MKKIIVLLLVLLLQINMCYAATKISKKEIPNFQAEMGTALKNLIYGKNTTNNLTYKEYMDDLYQQDYNWYKNVFLPNKNQMKRNYDYTEIIMQHSGELQSLSQCFWNDIEPIISKYNIEIDWEKNLWEYLNTSYFKKYNIPLADDFMELVESIQPMQYRLLELRTEIVDYSRNYEEAKADNFYKKNIENKSQFVNLDLTYPVYKNNMLKTGIIYTSQLKVVQVLSNGFLGQIMNPGCLIFVSTNLANKLEYHDEFVPALPLKFTGRYTTYTTILGSRNTVPIFEIILPKELKQRTALPKIGESFYFAEKPEWEIKLKDVNIVNYDYQYKYGTPFRSFLNYQ